MSSIVSKLVGSWSGYLQDSVWPLPVRIEHTLGWIFSILVHLSKHSISHPELLYTHFFIVIASYPLLIGDCPFFMLTLSFQLAGPGSDISYHCSHSYQSARSYMSTTLLVTHLLMRHSSLPIWSSEDSLWLCWLPLLAIRLRVRRRVKFHFYFEVLTKLPEVMIVELATIVCYQVVRDPISIDKVSTHKGNCLLFCDPAECFHLDPFLRLWSLYLP